MRSSCLSSGSGSGESGAQGGASVSSRVQRVDTGGIGVLKVLAACSYSGYRNS